MGRFHATSRLSKPTRRESHEALHHGSETPINAAQPPPTNPDLHLPPMPLPPPPTRSHPTHPEADPLRPGCPNIPHLDRPQALGTFGEDPKLGSPLLPLRPATPGSRRRTRARATLSHVVARAIPERDHGSRRRSEGSQGRHSRAEGHGGPFFSTNG